MTVGQVSKFARKLPEAVEEHPFGPNVDVMKVAGRIFAIFAEESVSLKCDPKEALRLRDEYAAITPGYHLNKRHWNTVRLDGGVPAEKIRAMVRDSYDLVVAKLPKEDRERLKGS